jgi:hypothetical protein
MKVIGIKFLLRAEGGQRDFITFYSHPIFTSDFKIKSCDNYSSKVAIVIQGPLVRENSFTLETIKLYRKNFPMSKIVISTWENERGQYVDQIKKEGVDVILNKLPSYPGPQKNVNYQMFSTHTGLQIAEKSHTRYVMKTRADQRLYGVDLSKYCIQLLNNFKIPIKSPQQGRIIGVSTGTVLTKKYHFSDMFQFGFLNDLLLYWDGKLLNKYEEFTFSSAEAYFFTRYLKKVGWEIKDTLEDSLEAYSRNCLVLDSSSLDFYWYKYKRYKEERKMSYSNGMLHNATFKEWFILFNKYSDK